MIQEKHPVGKQTFAEPIGWVVCLLPPSGGVITRRFTTLSGATVV